ncbi:lactate permease [Melghirimyces thermohalophilus]|uniref:Lactate permease n=1 Tax=Melghirimyces thermohalophilus TaxID=1236220 RepID=A0A1G6NBC7_9BACL|nr:lactate permease [Melghirimyces thermohalophilus]
MIRKMLIPTFYYVGVAGVLGFVVLNGFAIYLVALLPVAMIGWWVASLVTVFKKKQSRSA